MPFELNRRNALFGLAAGFGMTGGFTALAEDPAAPPMSLPTAVTEANEYATRPVAYIFGNIPVTRQDLGEFLIARQGAEKVELLVNKMIIEAACRRAGVTVTTAEMEAALAEDLSGLSIKKDLFVQQVLPRYGKSFYEWMEDVIRPRLLLSKLCRERIQVSDDDIRKQFEREYGEKRRVQVIMWPPTEDMRIIDKVYSKIRESQDEFDRAARTQANPALAGANGFIKPISRHLPTNEKLIEDRAFTMNPGEISEKIKTSQGFVVMKLHEVIPPAEGVKYEEVKPRLEKQAFDERMSIEIPKFFAELKAEAKPQVMFDGPTEWRFTAPVQTAEDVLKGAITGGQGPAVVPAGGVQK